MSAFSRLPGSNLLDAEPPSPADPAFSFAFQPIVDAHARAVVASEALIRGPWDEPAWQVLSQVAPPRLHLFDPIAHTRAIELAARLHLDKTLHLNFFPRSLHAAPDALFAVVHAARRAGFPLDRIVLEAPETDLIDDRPRFIGLINELRSLGIGLAIDDFSAAYASLSLLADLEPDHIKLDMRLIRGIERHPPRQAVLRAILAACSGLHIRVIAEGVETQAEFVWLSEQNVRYFQGYLFARPAFECFPPVHFASLNPPAAPPKRPAASASAGRLKKSRL